jgi:hypothetical protein
MNNNSRANDTHDEMIEMNDLSGGMMFNDNESRLHKLHPSTSKLYKEDRNNLKPKKKMPAEESKELSVNNSDSPRSKNVMKKSGEDDSISKSGSNKTSDTDKEFEALRKNEDDRREEVISESLIL